MKAYQRLYAIPLLVAFLLFQPASSMAWGWDAISDRVAQSSAYVTITNENGTGNCTAFSINETHGYWLTAAHCNVGTITLDDKPALVLFEDKQNDLLVLMSPLHKPALRIGTKPIQGQAVGAYGHALGVAAILMTGTVAAVDWENAHPQFADFPGKWVMLAFPLIAGMSGGPVVDMEGKVVAMNQWGGPATGFGRDAGTIWAATGGYWGPQN